MLNDVKEHRKWRIQQLLQVNKSKIEITITENYFKNVLKAKAMERQYCHSILVRQFLKASQ
ncbi:hypothetical protein ABH14_27620 [Brevibacillus brevis]|nr:hypothetical protein [Brevibacillus brevis]